MDAAQATYAVFAMVIVVAVVVSLALTLLVRTAKKTRALYGFSSPKEEAYPGYALVTAGVVIIMVSIAELAVLLTGPITAAPFAIHNISLLQGNAIEGGYIGLGFGVAFWIIMLWMAGKKLATLGLDLLKGKKVLVKISPK